MTGFSRPGHASLHAVALLEGNPYLGIGPGAESFIDGRLSRNLPDWSEYSAKLSEGLSPEGEGLVLDSDEAHLLRIWSSLKLRSGLLRSELTEAERALADRWMDEGVARRELDRVALSLEGWLRLDGLALEMARAEASSSVRLKGSKGSKRTP
jgi:oxygen-independent coproporphyrinogen-3 oxidase